MRQWMVKPELLCKKHLLGEHLEHHMFIGAIKKGKSISGYLSKGLVEPQTLHARHNSLVKEMKKRGFCHSSPLEKIDVSYLPHGKVDTRKSLKDLTIRCESCKERIRAYSKEIGTDGYNRS